MLSQLLQRSHQKRWPIHTTAPEVDPMHSHVGSNTYRIDTVCPVLGNVKLDEQHALFIKLDQVAKLYQSSAGAFVALQQIDLQVMSGEFIAVVGKSGSGKSTLINMITGIDRPTTGQVLVAGVAVNELNESQVATWRGRTVGVIFQFFQLLPTLTALENVMLPMDFCNVIPYRQRGRRARHLLEQVGMADQAHKLPTALSGGQQQRVAIARALANNPPLLVADEPTGNLDSQTADTVFQLFEALVAAGKTILVVTHDHELAMRMKRIVTIADGKVVEDRTLGKKEKTTSDAAGEGIPAVALPLHSQAASATQGATYALPTT